MAVQSIDLKLFTSAQGFGGAITATEVAGSNVLGIFSGAETNSGVTRYACVYVRNTSGQTAFNAKVFINNETSHDSVNATLALGNAAIGAAETATASNTTAPSVSFSKAAGAANALAIGDLAAGAFKAVWLKLVVPAGTTAKNAYTVEIGIDAETGE